MAFIVEMLRLIDGGKSPAEFRCDGDTWKNVLAVAEASGWQPSGTIPDPKLKHGLTIIFITSFRLMLQQNGLYVNVCPKKTQ